MKRRGFLGLLALLPALPALAKAALLEEPAKKPTQAQTLSWYGKVVGGDDQWHRFVVVRENGIEKSYIDDRLVKVVEGRTDPFEIGRVDTLIADFTIDFAQGPSIAITWPTPPAWRGS